MRASGASARGVALVTGAAQGIGLAIARRLAQDGYVVAMVDKDGERLEQAHAKIERTHPFQMDLLLIADLEPLVDGVERECGPIDVLVNDAGVVRTQPLLDVSPSDWEAIMGTNARAAFFLMQIVGGRMANRGKGAIVNVASVAGRSARPVQTVYGGSKATLLHLTKSAAAAFGPRGVRVNAVCPGVIDTEMTRRIWQDRTPEQVHDILTRIPLGRIGRPDEVAAAVAWLASAEAGYVNGQALNVCGGLEMD